MTILSSPRRIKIARVLCHPHVPVGDRAPTLWLVAEEAIFKSMTDEGGSRTAPTLVQPIIEAKTRVCTDLNLRYPSAYCEYSSLAYANLQLCYLSSLRRKT